MAWCYGVKKKQQPNEPAHICCDVQYKRDVLSEEKENNEKTIRKVCSQKHGKTGRKKERRS